MPEDKRQDIFISDSVYPDGEGIFNFSPKSLSELKKDSLVVLDTNTLLLPYSIGPNSIREIKQTYQKLVRQKRLFIPGQVAREFAKNRTNKISELFQQFNRKKAPKYPNQGRYPLLDEIEEYQDLLKLEQEIFALEKQYSQAVGKVLERIRSWGWNDPVSLIYHDLFYQGVVYEPEINREEITKDLERRQAYKLPPGYKDAGKDDQGIGDLLIWYSILDLAKKHKKSVLFISADQKPDWWCQSEGQPLYPRYELIDEFRRYSEGQTLGIIKFSDFVSLFGADETVVEEVRKEESQLRYSSGERINELRAFASIAEKAVLNWLAHVYGESSIKVNTDHKVPCDFILRKSTNDRVAVEVKTFRQGMVMMSRLKEWKLQAFYALEKSIFTEYMLVFVLPGGNEEISQRDINRVKNSFSYIDVPNFSLIFGVMHGDQFQPFDDNEIGGLLSQK